VNCTRTILQVVAHGSGLFVVNGKLRDNTIAALMLIYCSTMMAAAVAVLRAKVVALAKLTLKNLKNANYQELRLYCRC